MSSAYREKVKEYTDNFKQNAGSVQQMISDMESEVFAILKKKEKLREKITETREEKRLQPPMKERSELLLDDISDFANLYNLRQPADSKISGVEVENVGDRPVLGEAPKLTKSIVLEMNPAEVSEQLANQQQSPSTSPAKTAPTSPSAFDDNASSQISTVSAGGHSVQLFDQPSVACSFGFGFKSMKFPYIPLGCQYAIKVKPKKGSSASEDNNDNSNPSNDNSNNDTATTSSGAAALHQSPMMVPPVIEIHADETPVLGLRFSLVVPAALSTDLEIIRLKVQTRLDIQIEEMKESIEKAQKTFDSAVDEASNKDDDDKKEADTRKEKKKKDDNNNDVDMDEVSELLWKSLKLVVGVTRPAAPQSTTSNNNNSQVATVHITIYVYRILTDEQRARQAKLTDQVEEKVKNVVHEAGGDDELKEAESFAKTRTARQLSAVCRLIADCNFSAMAEVQVTATSNANNTTTSSSSSPLDGTQKPSALKPKDQQQHDDDDDSADNRQLAAKIEKKAESLVTRLLDSAPRIEKAIKEAAANFTGESAKKAILDSTATTGDKTAEQELAESKKKAVEQTLAFYKGSILPAVQRNLDPEDKVTKLINQLVGSDYFSPAKEALSNQQNAESPFAISINGHHAEINNLPKQLVRQTANMIYDYFLDTTESLSGRAYIGMSRRRTLAGVALYDSLHFNIIPLAQSSSKDTAKSACAFFHTEKVLRDSLLKSVEKAVEQAIDAKGKVSKAVDDEKSEEGKKLTETAEKAQSFAMKFLPSLSGANKDSMLSSTISTLKLGVKIGKNLFAKFQQDKKKQLESEEETGTPADERVHNHHSAFSFLQGQVCCCDPSRALECDIFMPESKAVCTFKIILRPARAETQSPRIKARRKVAKSTEAVQAQLQSQNCTGYCSAALPEFGLQIGEAFANLWLKQIDELVEQEDKDNKEATKEKKEE